jgi:hypothetical protein
LINNNKVDFLICGTQKGGTTALRHLLRLHPDIEMPKNEVHFFDNDKLFKNIEMNYEYYHRNFNSKNKFKCWGETTPIYMYWKQCPKRIHNYNPNVKIIVVLRNPVERAYSHWNMEFSRQSEALDFESAICSEKQRLGSNQHRVHSYIDRGYYSRQLIRLQKYFDKSKILILNSTDLSLNTASTINKITEFLGIMKLKLFNKSDKTFHKGVYQAAMSNETRRGLVKIFEEDLRLLEPLIDFSIEDWMLNSG